MFVKYVFLEMLSSFVISYITSLHLLLFTFLAIVKMIIEFYCGQFLLLKVNQTGEEYTCLSFSFSFCLSLTLGFLNLIFTSRKLWKRENTNITNI